MPIDESECEFPPGWPQCYECRVPADPEWWCKSCGLCHCCAYGNALNGLVCSECGVEACATEQFINEEFGEYQ